MHYAEQWYPPAVRDRQGQSSERPGHPGHRQIIFASFVLLFAITLQTPSVRNKQQTADNQKDQNTEQSVPVSANPSADEKKGETTQQSHWWPPPPLWDTYWPTIALVIVAGIAAKIAWDTLDDIKQQTVNAKTAADAALLNAQAIINAERAWIDMELLPVNPPQGSSDDFVAKRECKLQIINRGRTPAYVLSWTIGVGCPGVKSIHEFHLGLLTKIDSGGVHRFLEPGRVVNELKVFDLSHYFGTEWKDVLKGKKMGFFEVTISYADIVSSEDISIPSRDTYAAYFCRSDASLTNLNWLTKFR